MAKAATILHPVSGKYQRAVQKGEIWEFSDGYTIPASEAVYPTEETRIKMSTLARLGKGLKKLLQ